MQHNAGLTWQLQDIYFHKLNDNDLCDLIFYGSSMHTDKVIHSKHCCKGS